MIKVFENPKKSKGIQWQNIPIPTGYLVINCISCGCRDELCMVVCSQRKSESCFLCLFLFSSVRSFFSFSQSYALPFFIYFLISFSNPSFFHCSFLFFTSLVPLFFVSLSHHLLCVRCFCLAHTFSFSFIYSLFAFLPSSLSVLLCFFLCLSRRSSFHSFFVCLLALSFNSNIRKTTSVFLCLPPFVLEHT